MSIMVLAAIFTFTCVRVTAAAARPTHEISPASIDGPTFVGPIPTASAPLAIAPAPAVPSPRDEREGVLRIVVFAWAAGVVAMSLWHVGGWLWLRRMRRGKTLREWEDVMTRLIDRLGIRRAVALVETVRIDVPAVIGVLWPVVLVPAGIFTGLSPQQVEAILAH